MLLAVIDGFRKKLPTANQSRAARIRHPFTPPKTRAAQHLLTCNDKTNNSSLITVARRFNYHIMQMSRHSTSRHLRNLLPPSAKNSQNSNLFKINFKSTDKTRLGGLAPNRIRIDRGWWDLLPAAKKRTKSNFSEIEMTAVRRWNWNAPVEHWPTGNGRVDFMN